MARPASSLDSGSNCAKRPKAAVDPSARIMTSRALAGAIPGDAREAQFDGLECPGLLHAGGA